LIIRIVTILFFGFIVVVIWAADTNVLPKIITAIYSYPNGDKLGHFFLLGFLAFLINCSLPGQSITLMSIRIPVGSLVVGGLACLEEFSQSFFPSRTSSFLDLAFSLLGIVFFSFLSSVINRLLRLEQSSS
jgi:VanZ family protein